MPDSIEVKDLSDEALMDEIADRFAVLVNGGGDDKGQLAECLGFANEMFQAGRLRKASRKRAEEILRGLRGGATCPN